MHSVRAVPVHMYVYEYSLFMNVNSTPLSIRHKSAEQCKPHLLREPHEPRLFSQLPLALGDGFSWRCERVHKRIAPSASPAAQASVTRRSTLLAQFESLPPSLPRGLFLYGSLALPPKATAKEERGARGIALGTRSGGSLW